MVVKIVNSEVHVSIAIILFPGMYVKNVFTAKSVAAKVITVATVPMHCMTSFTAAFSLGYLAAPVPIKEVLTFGVASW